ncbi:MAG: fibronectin type III domain-containing protein [bacterium]|nr:fibronectin type III domain-containing protein [bacterium]
MTLNNFWKQIFASDITETWTFDVTGDYQLSGATYIEVANDSARLKKQQYTSDSNTSLLLHFDESSGNPVDSSSHNQQVTNTNAGFTSGIINNGLTSNGSNSSLSVADSAAVSLGVNHSIETWVKLNEELTPGSISQRQGIVDKGDYQLYFDQETGKLVYELANASATSWSQVAGNQINNSWDLDGHITAPAMTTLNTSIFVSLGSGTDDAEVWSWNGSVWSKIGGDGIQNSWAPNTFESVLSLTNDGTDIYAGLGLTAGDAEVWKYTVASSTWSKIGGDAINNSWQINTFEGVYSLHYVNGTLYAGLGASASDAEVWSWNGSDWTKIGGDSINNGWTTNYELVYTLENIGNTLYAGLGASTGDAELWRYESGSWSLVGGDGMSGSWANSTYEYVLSLEAIGGDLYVGLGLSANDAEVWRLSGGTWTQVGGDSLNNGWTTNFEGVYKLSSDGTDLYAGLGASGGDNEIWRYTVSAGTWSKIAGDGLNSSFNNTHTIVDSMTFIGSTLYAGVTSGNTYRSGQVWELPSGGTWRQIGGDQINDSWSVRGLQNVEVMSVHGEYLYAGTGNVGSGNATVWRFDGSTWEFIGGQGKNNSWPVDTYENVLSMVSYNGELVVGLGTTANDAEVWGFDGSTWTKIGGDSINNGWSTNFEEVASLAVIDDTLYAGLGNSANDAEVWSYNGTDWTKIGGDSINNGWSINFERVNTLSVLGNTLYAGLGASVNDAEVWMWNGSTWTKVGGDGLNSSWNTEFEQVESSVIFENNLYVGLGNGTGDAELWMWNGSTWTKVGGDDVNSSWTSGTYERVKTLTVYNGAIFAGIGNGTGDGEVWRFNGSSWTQVGGDSINSSYSNAIEETTTFTGYRGKLYAGTGLSANLDAQVWVYGANGYLSSEQNSFTTEWQHIAATYDGNTMRLIINGAEDATLNVSLQVPDTSKSLSIATLKSNRESGKEIGTLNGMLDELRISKVKRTTFNTTPYSSDPQTIEPSLAVFTSQVNEFDAFTATEQSNGGAVSYRLSNDAGDTWKYWNGSAWATSSSLNQSNSATTINSEIASFPVSEEGILWQAVLDGDGRQEVIVQDVSIGAVADTVSPTNPDSITVLNEEAGDTELTTDTWYGHVEPYFSWSGAEDLDSGVAGYYVYFGPDNTADPVTAGTFQTGTNFTPLSVVSNQSYFLRIKTRDSAFNSSSSIWDGFVYKFDNGNPTNPSTITVTPAGYAATNNFTFTWPAASDGGSGIQGYQYKTGTPSGTLADWSGTITQTSVTIPEAAYQDNSNTFYLRTLDLAGNSSTAPLQANYYFAGEGPTPPRFLNVTPSSSTTNSFAFAWQPPDAYSGELSEITYCYTVNVLPSSTNCSFTSAGATSISASAFATQQGLNTFYLVSKNGASGGSSINYGTYVSATFEANTASPGIPLNADIADVSVKSSSSWKLAISWEPPTETASGISSYKIFRSSDNVTFSEVASTTGIAYVDTGLAQQTYFYAIKACDSVQNCSASSTTLEMLPDGKYTEAPLLLDEQKVSSVTTKGATITWTTDRQSDSKIQYGLSPDSFFSSEPSNSVQKTAHSISLANLQPGTTYYYKAKWTDDDGNTGMSKTASFTTSPPPSIQDVVVKSISLSGAVVEFTSTGASSVRVLYGKTVSFGGITELSTSTSESTYIASLDELEDGQKYFYKVNAYDSEGNEYEGTILAFETLPKPKVSLIRVQQVKGSAQPSVLVSWTSNTPISSIITYYPESDPSLSRDEVNIVLQNGEHRMLLKGLQPKTPYVLVVKGRDKAGNEALSEVQRLTTSTDTRPPQISNLKIESSTLNGTGSDQAISQLIVSWDTDEAAASQVEFAEGTGTTYQQKTQEDQNLTYNHVVVVGNLSPSKVYHLRALSKDSAANEGASADTVIITSKATDNALELVINNLQQAFGFLKNIR